MDNSVGQLAKPSWCYSSAVSKEEEEEEDGGGSWTAEIWLADTRSPI